MVSLSNHLHHNVHAHAPYSVGLWRSPSLRAKQPCHADVGLCEGGHLWLRFTLHAGVTLRSTTCITSYRPYGARLPRPAPSHNGVASRHREERSDPFMTDLWKICFQKITSISLPVTYPTTNDCCRLQTFNQRVGFDNWRFFATQSQKHRKWKNYNKGCLALSTPNSKANRKRPSSF